MSTSTPPLAQFAESLEEREFLDGLADTLDGVADAVFATDAIYEVFTTEQLGAPLHPAMVHVPIGGAITALALELLGGGKLTSATTIATGLTVLGALPAAVAGLADFTDAEDPGFRRVAAAHAHVNIAGTALALASLITRLSGSRGWPRLLLMGAVGAYGLGGLLGGHMVYGMAETEVDELDVEDYFALDDD